jgi:hypothetical protein
MSDFDQHAARELELYVDNDGELYRQQGLPILKNLALKMYRGAYDHGKAVKLYMYYMESGAKKYAREFGEGREWHSLFSVPTRRHVAEQFAKFFETEWQNGSYRDLLPKKWQAVEAKLARAFKG